jgi:hypothetical protein
MGTAATAATGLARFFAGGGHMRLVTTMQSALSQIPATSDFER